MQLTIQKVVPHPLRATISANSSDIWMQQHRFSKGQRIAVIAPSGKGKTTFFHLLNGIRSDYDGTITWGDRDLRWMDSDELSKLRAMYIGTVFQDLRLLPQLTVWENLELKRGITNTITPEKMQQMLHQLGIAEKKDSPCRTLSYGEQQRVAIIRALLQPFDWLLLDEPFSHLDHMNIEKAVMLILEMAQKHQAGILITGLEDNDYFQYHQKLYL